MASLRPQSRLWLENAPTSHLLPCGNKPTRGIAVSSGGLSAPSEQSCRGCRWQSAAAGSSPSGAHSGPGVFPGSFRPPGPASRARSPRTSLRQRPRSSRGPGQLLPLAAWLFHSCFLLRHLPLRLRGNGSARGRPLEGSLSVKRPS